MMDLPPLHAEVERLGLDEIVEKARILLTDRDWLLDATEDLIALEPELNNEQRRFLLAIGLDALIRDLEEEGRG
jgi:hypothetical protein